MQTRSWRALLAVSGVVTALAAGAGTAADAAPPSQWPGLGAPFAHVYQLEAAHNADGRLEVFVDGTLPGQLRNGLYHRWQLRNGGWSGWSQLSSDGGRFAVINESDGRIRVFEATPDNVRSVAQNGPDGGWGVSSSLGVPSGPGELIAAGRDTAGRVHAFASTKDHTHVNQIDEVAANCGCWGVVWSAGVFDRSGITDLKLGYNADGRPEVFAMHWNTHEVWHRWQSGNGTWSPWVDLGSPGLHAGLTLLNDFDGRLSVITVTTDEGQNARVVAISQTGPNGGWVNVWRTLTTVHPGHDGWWVAAHAARDADGTPELYLRSEEDPSGEHLPNPNLYRLELAPNIGSWSQLTMLDPAVPATIDPYSVATALDSGGRLWLFTARMLANGQRDIVFQEQRSPGVW